ncbi:MAG: hypothetical protein KAK00_10390 [Nanoarchaeota archaeon]|nr:hypothetical protein [Nanoarchaeota archaeon]
MKFEINIEKKHLYVIVAFVVLATVSIIVAYTEGPGLSGGKIPNTVGYHELRYITDGNSMDSVDANQDGVIDNANHSVEADHAATADVATVANDALAPWLKTAGNDLYYNDGNVGIGTATPSAKLDVQGGAVKASGGLIIETRTDDPASPETGRIWLRTDI